MAKQVSVDKFEAVAKDPLGWVKAWKDSHPGKKVVGTMGLYVPAELIHAGGILPIVLPETEEPITLGDTLLSNIHCSYTRCVMDLALKGQLNFLDGIVTLDICQPLRAISDLLRLNVPQIGWHKPLWFPTAITKLAARDRLMAELKEFKQKIDAFVGRWVCVEDEVIHNSFKLYNEYRGLMRKVYELRRQKPGVLSLRQMLAVVISGMTMPKEEIIPLLKELTADMEKAPGAVDGKVKVVLSGGLCRAPRWEIVDMIDKFFNVVDDDMSVGSHYFDRDVKPEGDPLEEWAAAYLSQTAPCPALQCKRVHWGDYLLDMAKRTHAEGVLSLRVMYCDPHQVWYPLVRGKLVAAGIPEYLLETEHSMLALGPVRTRLEAFVETIRAR